MESAAQWIDAHASEDVSFDTMRRPIGWDGLLRVYSGPDCRPPKMSSFRACGTAANYRGSEYIVGDLDGQVALHFSRRHWSDPPHLLIVRDGEIDIFVDASEDETDRLVLRTVRLVGKSALLSRRAAIQVHASAVSAREGGALFVGKSGAGKTSASIEMAIRGMGLVSTDRTLLLAADSGVMMVGGPDIVRVGYGFLDARLNGLHPEQSVRYDHRTSGVQDSRDFGSRSKAEFGLGEFGRMGNLRTVDSGLLTHIILPSVTSKNPRLQQLGPAEAFSRTAAEVLHPDPVYGYPLGQDICTRNEALERWMEVLSRHVVLSLEWNPHELDRTSDLFDEVRQQILSLNFIQ